MPAPRILFVKLSSLGDVIHHLPAVTDLRAHRPDVAIGWAVEEAYAELVRLHPAVSEVIPVAFRRLRRNVLAARGWSDTRRALRAIETACCFWRPKPSHSRSSTRAPCRRASSAVPSVLPESTTRISSAKPTLSRQRGSCEAALSVMMATVSGSLASAGVATGGSACW